MKYLSKNVWSHPSSYAGYSPDGDYLIVSRHRDDDDLTESNWAYVCKTLKAEAYDEGTEGYATRPNVYHWRAGHCMVGWVEYLMVRQDAPESVLKDAEAILKRLDAYPALDEDDWSEREYNSAMDYWASMSVRDRIYLLKDSGTSIFAARRAELPQDDTGYIMERLRG